MLDINAFGSPRARAWAQRINNAQSLPANQGFRQAGINHPDVAKTNKLELSTTIRNTAPPVEGRTQMRPVGSLGSGNWHAVG